MALREKHPYSEFFWFKFSRIRDRKSPITDTLYPLRLSYETIHIIFIPKEATNVSSGLFEAPIWDRQAILNLCRSV